MTRSRSVWLATAIAIVAAAAMPAVADDGGVSDGGTLPSGDMISFPELLIHEGGSAGLAVPSTLIARDMYFNQAHCLCGAANGGSGSGAQVTFSEQIELTVPDGDTTPDIPLNIYVGSDCNGSDGARTADCTLVDMIPDITALEDNPVEPEIPVFTLMNPTPGTTMCTPATGEGTIWAVADTNGDGVDDFFTSATIAFDTQAPTPPVDFNAEGADGAILLTWQNPPSGTTDVAYYQALCATTTGAAAGTGVAAQYITANQLCGVDQGFMLAPAALQTHGTATPDANVLTAPFDGIGSLDPTYLCGQATKGATTMTINGLTNGTPYYVALIAVDAFGNPAGMYATTPVTPAPVEDFWEDLHARGSKTDGGFCLLAETYGEHSWLTTALRAFRDDNLASTSAGRWLTDAYYATLAPLGRQVAGSLALRIIAAIALLPVVAIALVWHVLTLPGLLALIAFGLALRRRRRRLAGMDHATQRQRARVDQPSWSSVSPRSVITR